MGTEGQDGHYADSEGMIDDESKTTLEPKVGGSYKVVNNFFIFGNF